MTSHSRWSRTEQPTREVPTLWFTPAAWIKLNWLCHAGWTEIGAFGLVEDPSRNLLVSELHLIEQTAGVAQVSFADEAVADYFERMVDRGRRPDQFARVWLHSHPGSCPQPSGTDEQTFERVFGRCDWAIMFILARDGSTYARLRFAAGPGGQIRIPVAVRWDLAIGAIDQQAWRSEYHSLVQPIDDCLRWPQAAAGAEQAMDNARADIDRAAQLSDVVLPDADDRDGRLLHEMEQCFERGPDSEPGLPWYEQEEGCHGRRYL